VVQRSGSNRRVAQVSHDSSGFPNFSKKYRKELEQRAVSRKAFGVLLELARGSNRPTPVYASKDTEHNNAAVLKKVLEERIQLLLAPTSPPGRLSYAHSALQNSLCKRSFSLAMLECAKKDLWRYAERYWEGSPGWMMRPGRSESMVWGLESLRGCADRRVANVSMGGEGPI
jgi:hypothetical protein